MRIDIVVARDGMRAWHLWLAQHLSASRLRAEVRLRVAPHPAPWPREIATLLALEKLILRRGRGALCDRVAPPAARGDGAPDIVLDCTSGALAAEAGPRVLRPLFNGDPDEHALLAGLLAGKDMRLAIEDRGAGLILADGSPSLEAAHGLTGAIEAIVTRMPALIERALGSKPGDNVPPVASIDYSASLMARFAVRKLVSRTTRTIARLAVDSPHWRIGWRLHDGPGVFERGDLGGPAWRVLPDPGDRCYADPFPVTWRGATAVFFEDLDHRLGRARISGIAFEGGGPVGPVFPVIEEPWHLSYPFLIEHGGELWMIPEGSTSGAVWIYRCVAFPHRWERHGALMQGIEAADCTIVRHDGRFFMTSVTRDGAGGYSDILRIHHAPDLFGPWEEHALRPIMIEACAARPAGAIVARDGVLWRPAQDCRGGYGRALNLVRIDRLTPDDYRQTCMGTVQPGPLFPGERLHTLNRAGRLECIDGAIVNPRLAVLRGLATRAPQGGEPEPRDAAHMPAALREP